MDCTKAIRERESSEEPELKKAKKSRNPVTGFPPESFDRILLDPPCSALGLRPRVIDDSITFDQLEIHADYQKHLLSKAVELLRPGGILSYSTCTITPLENEVVVKHGLDKLGLKLQELPSQDLKQFAAEVASPGLDGFGLSPEERKLVYRFDPLQNDQVPGFFFALFKKN